jgi:hypothetical protein
LINCQIKIIIIILISWTFIHSCIRCRQYWSQPLTLWPEELEDDDDDEDEDDEELEDL